MLTSSSTQGLHFQGLLSSRSLESVQYPGQCLHTRADNLQFSQFLPPFMQKGGLSPEHAPTVHSQLNFNCCSQMNKLHDYELALSKELKLQQTERFASGLLHGSLASSGHIPSLTRSSLFSVESGLTRLGADVTTKAPISFSTPLKPRTSLGYAHSMQHQLFTGGVFKPSEQVDLNLLSTSQLRAFPGAGKRMHEEFLAKLNNEFHWPLKPSSLANHWPRLGDSEKEALKLTEADTITTQNGEAAEDKHCADRRQEKDSPALSISTTRGNCGGFVQPSVVDAAGCHRPNPLSSQCLQTSAATVPSSSPLQSSAGSGIFYTTPSPSSAVADHVTRSSTLPQSLALSRKQGKFHSESPFRQYRSKPYLKRRFRPQRQHTRGFYGQNSGLSQRFGARGDASHPVTLPRNVTPPGGELTQPVTNRQQGEVAGQEIVHKSFESGGHQSVLVEGVEDVRKSFRCPQCRYLTDRKNNLKRHIVTMHHTSARLLECCGALFTSKASLRDHVTLFHRGGYRCQVCGRNFCRKALLRRHLTVHSGQKDFACHLCGYATSHKSNLERHQRVHARKSDLTSSDPALPDFEHGLEVGQRNSELMPDPEEGEQSMQAEQAPWQNICHNSSVVNDNLHHTSAVSNHLKCGNMSAQRSADQSTISPCMNYSGGTSQFGSSLSQNAADRNGDYLEDEQLTSDELFGDERRISEMRKQTDGIRPTSQTSRGQSRKFSLPDRLKETYKESSSLTKGKVSVGNVRVNPTGAEVTTRTSKTSQNADLGSNTKENENPSKPEAPAKVENCLEIPSSLKSKSENLRDPQNILATKPYKEMDLDALSSVGEQKTSSKCEHRHPLQVSRRRICCRPYRCFNCGVSFPRQEAFQSHVCNGDLGSGTLLQFSVTSAVRKGCIESSPKSGV